MPPEASQWKKGRSGNPSGKKKVVRPQPILDSLAEQFDKVVEISANGKKTKVTMLEAVVTKLMHDLMAAELHGKLNALVTLQRLGFFEFHKELIESQAPKEEVVFGEEERRLLEYLTKEAREAESESGCSTAMSGGRSG
jgi:hypothetical protein